jgi:aspartyl-tRNA(Asn)/glutamyl-tRNA(Gln) amidotransferase subunit A
MYGKTRAAGFGAEVKRRIMLGDVRALAGYYDAYYGKAQQVRTLVRPRLRRGVREGRRARAPTTPGVAFKMGEKDDPLRCTSNDVFTVPCNLPASPACRAVRASPQAGLPIGLQLIGRAFDEATLLRAAPPTSRHRLAYAPPRFKARPTGAPMRAEGPEEARPPAEIINIQAR